MHGMSFFARCDARSAGAVALLFIHLLIRFVYCSFIYRQSGFVHRL